MLDIHEVDLSLCFFYFKYIHQHIEYVTDVEKDFSFLSSAADHVKWFFLPEY